MPGFDCNRAMKATPKSPLDTANIVLPSICAVERRPRSIQRFDPLVIGLDATNLLRPSPRAQHPTSQVLVCGILHRSTPNSALSNSRQAIRALTVIVRAPQNPRPSTLSSSPLTHT